MKRSGIRKNNRGDSLILVIGCIALLSIVGVILLAKSMDNRNMKVAEEQAQASFAGAETGSAEIVTVIENVTFDVIEDAFADMLLEYSLMADNTARKDRYNKYFKEKVEKLLYDEHNASLLQQKLEDALGDATVTNLTVEHLGEVDTIEAEAGYTDTVRLKEVVFTYTTAGSETKITTDICVRALLPDVNAGFSSGISCDFTDFALIADGDVKVTSSNDMQLTGNLYTGGNLITSGNTVATKINKATKLLVKKEIQIDNNAGVWVEDGGVTFGEGEGIWADGISVKGSTLSTEGVNLYIRDDLAVEGTTVQSNIEMKGSETNTAEYVGYSGNDAALVNHERSSAININESKDLTLNMEGLTRLYINGNSYICESNNNWGAGLKEDGITMESADGILQGESIAYKDMQSMYLYPGSCLPNHSHNPIIGEDVEVGTPSLTYKFMREGSEDEEEMDLRLYVDNANPYVTRTARLDGGATVLTYVYLNFKSEAAAAQYVTDYMTTFMGENVKEQIHNLGSNARIKLPADTYTLSNAISYDGTDVTVHPAAIGQNKAKLDIVSLMAEQRYKGLFSSLRAEGAAATNPSYQMVKDGIVNVAAVAALGAEDEITMPDPVHTDKDCVCYVHNGDLTIVEHSKYTNMKGILLVNGNLNITTTPVTIDGLVLVTGEVTEAGGAILTHNERVVDLLLSNDDVAKYFKVYGATSGAGYLSTEAVEISFDNWQKND